MRTAPLAMLLLGGCGFGLFLQNDPMGDAVADFQPGVNSRADVLALLGAPLLSLPERGVEVFEREGELTDVLLPGIPYTTRHSYHTLISYDESGTLTGIDTGGYVYRSTLKADRFRYQMGYPGTLLEQEATPAYRVGADGCVVVLLVAGNRWSDKLYYQDPIRLNDLVLQGPPDYESYYYLVMAPGLQALSVVWSRRSGPASEERSFDCASGDLVYATLNADREDSTVVIGSEIPPELPGRALILFPPRTEAPVSTAAGTH